MAEFRGNQHPLQLFPAEGAPNCLLPFELEPLLFLVPPSRHPIEFFLPSE